MMSPRRGKLHNLCSNGILLGLIMLLILFGASSVQAFDVFVDGYRVELANRPALRQARAMVPLNCLADALGVSIEPTPDETMVLLYMGSREIRFFIDNPLVSVEDKTIDLGVAPYIAKGAIMVPLNFFHDVLGVGVQWDEGHQILYMGERPESSVVDSGSSAKTTVDATPEVELSAKAKSDARQDTQDGSNQDPETTTSGTTIDTTPDRVAMFSEGVVTGGKFTTMGSEATEQDTKPEEDDEGGKVRARKTEQRIEGQRSPTTAISTVASVPISETQVPSAIYLEREGLAISQLLKDLYRGPQGSIDEMLDRESRGPELPEGPRLLEVRSSMEDGRQRLDFVCSDQIDVEPVLYSNPAQLALDMPGVRVDGAHDELYVGSGTIQGVRLAQYSENLTRAVVDLVEATGYQIVPLDKAHGFSVVFNQRIGRVSLGRSGNYLRLKLETSGSVLYSVSKLKQPDRMVVDVANATFVAGAAEVAVNDSAVKKLRISQYTPTSTRIVLDLAHGLDIGDIEIGGQEGTVELVFIDGKTQPAGGGNLATLGRSFKRLLPNSVAYATGEKLLSDVAVTATPSEFEAGCPIGPLVEQDQDKSSPWADDHTSALDYAGDLEQLGLNDNTEDSPVFPAFRRSNVDFSLWPTIQVNWLEPQSSAVLKGKTVLIDPGHGGLQPGALGVQGVREKVYNLKVALRVGELLQWAGADVSYTRIGDRTVSLRERVDAVQAVNADILLSIHANASLTKDATGTETLYHPGRPADRLLASALQENVVSQLGLFDRGIKQRSDLYILRHSPVPSALVEVGFLDHVEEGPFILTAEAIEKASMGLVRGVVAFFRDMDVVERTITKGPLQLPKGPNGMESSDETRSAWEDSLDGDEDIPGGEETPSQSAGSDILE